MSEKWIGLVLCIILFIISAIHAYNIWFRDGARKAQRMVLKYYDENAPGQVSKFDKVINHPIKFKAGSILMLIGCAIGTVLLLMSIFFN